MARKFIQIYHDFTETAELMNDTDLANLIRAMLHYGRDENPAPWLQNEVVKVLFNGSFKGQIDRNKEYDEHRSEWGKRLNEIRWGKQRSGDSPSNIHNNNNNNNDNGNFLTVTQGGEKKDAEHRGDTDGDVRLGNETIL